MTLDARGLRRIFSAFATGVTVVTAYDEKGAPIGITANSLSSVSLDPPLILWCLDNRSRHLSAFSKGSPFAIHILSEAQENVAREFARSGAYSLPHRDDNTPGFAPRIEGVLARMECRVAALHLAGDHTVIIGGITGTEVTDSPPLVFHKSTFGRFEPAGKAGGQEAWHSLVDMWS